MSLFAVCSAWCWCADPEWRTQTSFSNVNSMRPAAIPMFYFLSVSKFKALGIINKCCWQKRRLLLSDNCCVAEWFGFKSLQGRTRSHTERRAPYWCVAQIPACLSHAPFFKLNTMKLRWSFEVNSAFHHYLRHQKLEWWVLCDAAR